MRRLLSLALLLLAAVPGARPSSPVVRDSVLVIPAGTVRIAPRAFADRDDFHSIVFETPCRLAEIGEYAFLGCSSLRELTLPEGTVKVGTGAFRECTALSAARLPESLTVLPRYMFAWCRSLESVAVSSVLADVQAHAFAYCASLSGFDFGRRVRHIGSNAFSFCSALEEVSLPGSVTELESYAFSECVSLRKATLPANNHLLGELIFSGCRNLELLTVLSAFPPKFDCESTIFEATETRMYDRCRLRVPRGKVAVYRDAPGWCLFLHVEPAVAP